MKYAATHRVNKNSIRAVNPLVSLSIFDYNKIAADSSTGTSPGMI